MSGCSAPPIPMYPRQSACSSGPGTFHRSGGEVIGLMESFFDNERNCFRDEYVASERAAAKCGWKYLASPVEDINGLNNVSKNHYIFRRPFQKTAGLSQSQDRVDLNKKKQDFAHLLFNEANADRILGPKNAHYHLSNHFHTGMISISFPLSVLWILFSSYVTMIIRSNG